MAREQNAREVILTGLVRRAFSGMKIKFRPCVIRTMGIDQLLILEEDCSFTEEQSPDSNIAILRKNHGEDAGKVVGVVIYRWSRWKKNL